MRVNYELTAKDLLEFNYFFHWSSPKRKETRIVNSFMPLSILVLGIPFFKGLNIKAYGMGEWLFLVLGVVLIFLMPHIVKRMYANSVKRLINSGKNSTLLGNKTVIFEGDKVIEETELASSTILWHAFEELQENPEYFFLFQNSNQAVIIPKRALKSDYDVGILRKQIIGHLGMNPTAANLLQHGLLNKF